MAKPRVFVSSTYFDLKYVRASLDVFINSLGYEPVLSEKGDIAYTHDRPLDVSCYREAENSDIFVLIVGGRYGSEASQDRTKKVKTFFERYESITKKEYESAIRRDLPIYIFVESGVYAEYLTFQRNRDNTQISYAHVDSVNIFKLLDEILAKPRNNQIKTFERYDDIEMWLRDQWAGLFRELLVSRSEHQQLSALSAQVSQLSEMNATLKTYLEAVVSKTVDDSAELISSEDRRLDEARKLEAIRSNQWFRHVESLAGLSLDAFVRLASKAKSFEDFSRQIARETGKEDVAKELLSVLQEFHGARRDYNKVREHLGLKPFPNPRRKKLGDDDSDA